MRAVIKTLLILALILAPISLMAQGEAPPAPMSEAQFIELAGAEKPGDRGGQEPGRPHQPAKSIEEPKGKKEEESESDDGSDSDDDSTGSGDGDGEDGAGDADDAGDEAGSGDGDEEEKKEEKVKGADDSEDAGDSDEDEAEDKATLDAEFQAALEAEGASPSLEDIPEEARPIVAKKLRDLERGFTKAMQQTRADQKAALTFRAEERFRKEKPADFIVSMLLENPKVAEEVNDRIGELEGNSTAVEGHKALVEKARSEAAKAENAADEKRVKDAEASEARTEHFVRVGRAAARAAGVPFDMGVEEGIAAHILIHGDITDDQIRTIAKQKAAVYNRTRRQDKRDSSGKYVKDKVGDRKRSAPKVTGSGGSSPVPGAKRMAKSDEEFIEEFSGRS